MRVQPPFRDGVYEVRVHSYCDAKTGYLGQQSTGIITGLVDRKEPEMFGQFAEPADGTWWPGDAISVRFMESLDCRTPHSFGMGISMLVCGNENSFCDRGKADLEITPDDLFLLCTDDTIEVAFKPSPYYAFDDLIGKRVTVFLESVQDKAGNQLRGRVRWSFQIAKFDLSEVDVRIKTLYFKNLDFYSVDSLSDFANSLEKELAAASGINASMVSVEDVRPGSIIIDISLMGYLTLSPYHHYTLAPHHHLTLSPHHHLTLSLHHHLTLSLLPHTVSTTSHFHRRSQQMTATQAALKVGKAVKASGAGNLSATLFPLLSSGGSLARSDMSLSTSESSKNEAVSNGAATNSQPTQGAVASVGGDTNLAAVITLLVFVLALLAGLFFFAVLHYKRTEGYKRIPAVIEDDVTFQRNPAFMVEMADLREEDDEVDLHTREGEEEEEPHFLKKREDNQEEEPHYLQGRPTAAW